MRDGAGKTPGVVQVTASDRVFRLTVATRGLCALGGLGLSCFFAMMAYHTWQRRSNVSELLAFALLSLIILTLSWLWSLHLKAREVRIGADGIVLRTHKSERVIMWNEIKGLSSWSGPPSIVSISSFALHLTNGDKVLIEAGFENYGELISLVKESVERTHLLAGLQGRS